MYSPRGYNMYPVRNVYDKEGQGRPEFVYFFPGFMNRKGCYDNNGMSDVTKALKEILEERYRVKYNTTDINAITKAISEVPITPQEAIIKSQASIFPITDLNARINQIDMNPSAYNDVFVGDLAIDKNNKVTFVPTNDMPIREFPTQDNKVKGALEIFNMPETDREGNIFSDRYILSADPYDDDVSNTMSLGSVFVLDLWTDTLAAEYTGRPMYADDFFEMCRKLCFFYNGKLMYENNKKGLFAYFSRYSCTHLLADTPQYLKDQQLIKDIGYGNKAKGVIATAAIKNYGYKLIRDWLLKPFVKIDKDNEGNDIETEVPNLYRIRNRALLKELILWNPNCNVDRIMSLVQMMLYREEKMVLYRGNLSFSKGADRKDDLANDDFWNMNYDKRFSSYLDTVE